MVPIRKAPSEGRARSNSYQNSGGEAAFWETGSIPASEGQELALD